MKATEMCHREVNDGLDIFGTGNIGLLEGNGFPQLISKLLAPLGVHVSDDNLGSFFDEPFHSPSPNAGNATRDDRDLSLQ
jgi:hypothetical protein